MFEVTAPLVATVVHVAVQPGEEVAAGTLLVALESMKMEYPVRAEQPGRVTDIRVAPGDTVIQGQLLATLAAPVAPAPDTDVQATDTDVQVTDADAGHAAAAGPADAPDRAEPAVRADLAALQARRTQLADAARPDTVATRHATGRRTARENVAALVDREGFVEYGGLVIAAQRQRRPLDELQAATPADGLIAGIGPINGALFGAEPASCVVLAYDYTVLAGTQGFHNHRKKDRMLALAAAHRLPVVLFAEGGGGRPGDTDVLGASWLDAEAFHLFARLAGRVPTIAVVDGYCFAGNAALAGAADLLIATETSNLGMAGPAMIEGGGLGRHAPETIGPIEVQRTNGVVDVVVPDDATAVEVAREALALLQGDLAPDVAGEAADQTPLRTAVPEDRRQLYDLRAVLERLVDPGSLLELRRDAAPGMITALARLDGRTVGVLANDPHHLGGAIDAAGADSAVRHLELCDAHGLPVVVLCDTPGFMVGPEAERDGGVRRFSRMFVAAARLRVPLVGVVTRKAYGLGAQAMLGGHLRIPVTTLAWPTAELGPMGLEGAVRLGFRRELAAITDPDERAAREAEMIAAAYTHAGALNVASFGELDDVIDPAETRQRISLALDAAGVGRRAPRTDRSG